VYRRSDFRGRIAHSKAPANRGFLVGYDHFWQQCHSLSSWPDPWRSRSVAAGDPAGKGTDSTAIAWRRGQCVVKTERRRGLDTMEVAGWVVQIIRADKPAKVNIDVGGLGIGVYDRLIEQGFDSSWSTR
jgi:hypothetical protein